MNEYGTTSDYMHKKGKDFTMQWTFILWAACRDIQITEWMQIYDLVPSMVSFDKDQ